MTDRQRAQLDEHITRVPEDDPAREPRTEEDEDETEATPARQLSPRRVH
jgi:hypothetical protein